MKKNYFAPETFEVGIKIDVIMTDTSTEQDETGTGDGEAGDGTPDLSSGKRGSWGDVWK